MLTKEDRQFITDTVAVAVNRAFDEKTSDFAKKSDLVGFATKDDLDGLRVEVKGVKKELAKFATKDDLIGFATKKDLENFATKKDLESFATKKDLESFATKKDLESFATKKDIESFATKDDLGRFATKSDLFGMEKRIKKDIRAEIHDEVEVLAITTQKEFGVVHSELATINKKLDTVAATTREHEYYIRKFSVDIDQLKQRAGLTD